jgi:hypothetical protein
MDIEEFYDADPRRRESEETEFGREWSDANGARTELSWVADTGELYAMAEPYDRRGITTASVTVEVLGLIHERAAVHEALTGWQDAMARPDGLAWVRARAVAATR